jgi:DNA modification methylase
MGVGCPEYVLLFRKRPTDNSTAYADDPVTKNKSDYTRAQWQLDAHGYWRSSGDRPISTEELKNIPTAKLQSVYTKYSKSNIYDYSKHVELAEKLDKEKRLPTSFMVLAPASWATDVWTDITRIKTLNSTQARRNEQMHVCPLQLDIVERIINRYSNKGDTVLDPFGGLMSVPMTAVKMGRYGIGIELNPDYFRDGIGYLKAAEDEIDTPTLFDYIEEIS